MSNNNQAQFESGAVRAEKYGDKVRYDLLLSNDVAMRRIAETYAEGYKKGYAHDNWKKGFPVSELFAHAFIHLMKWISGDKSEDHLAHACWNLMAIMWQEERKPEFQDYPPIATLQSTTPDAPGKTDAIIRCGLAVCEMCRQPAITHQRGMYVCANHMDNINEQAPPPYPKGACPLFEGTPKAGEEWHDTLTYTGTGGRCEHCSAKKDRHYGYIPLDK